MSNTRRGLPITSSRIEKIFPKLTPAQLSRIAARGHIRAVEGGEVLYEQGYSAAPLFVVISGELEVARPSIPRTAIGSLVEDTHLKEDYIIPKVNDPRILPFVTETLKKAIESTLKDVTETRQVDK